MDFIKLMRKLFGNKSDRDMKAIQPLVNEVLKVYPEIQALSNDELRARTKELQARIREAGVPLRNQIDELKAKIEQTPIEDRKPMRFVPLLLPLLNQRQSVLRTMRISKLRLPTSTVSWPHDTTSWT